MNIKLSECSHRLIGVLVTPAPQMEHQNAKWNWFTILNAREHHHLVTIIIRQINFAQFHNAFENVYAHANEWIKLNQKISLKMAKWKSKQFGFSLNLIKYFGNKRNLFLLNYAPSSLWTKNEKSNVTTINGPLLVLRILLAASADGTKYEKR